MGARILVVDDSPTIRKVVAAILEARDYETLTAEDGQQALEQLASEKVDLVLLDFVMPRMNGYQFCRELRANADLRNLPVVLMSAKGDKIRGHFVQQTGAMDAITKPFDPRGLVAVVEGALKRHEEGRAPPTPDAAAMPEEEQLEQEEFRPSVTLSDDPEQRRVEAAAELGARLGKILLPELLKASGLARSAGPSLSEAVQRSLTPDALTLLSPVLREIVSDLPVLAGDLSVISTPEILQVLQMQRQSGALTFTRGGAIITLYLGEGNVDYANYKGPRDEFLLGRYLVAQGGISREHLDRVLENTRTGQLLGEHLIDRELITAEHLQRALTTQTEEVVYELVRWDKGRFSFQLDAAVPAATKAKLGLGIRGLMMEGFRRVDEWRLIEGSFDFGEVLYRDPSATQRIADESKLTVQERAVLEAIDGERTVGEIIDDIEGSSFELCKILYQFLNSRIVRRSAA